MGIADKLSQLAASLRSTEAQHQIAAKRWRAKHDKAHHYRRQFLALEQEADDARKAGHVKHAQDLDDQAQQARAAADAAHRAARAYIAQAKRLKAKIRGIEQHADELKKAAAKQRRQHGLKIDGNYIKGNAPGGVKVMAAFHAAGSRCASGSRRNVYSQSGPFIVDRFITGEPAGARSDCSQAYIAAFHSAGLPSPSGSWGAGFTGSIADHGKRITRAEAADQPAAAVEWGSYPYHHIEAAEGDGSTDTWGHGSPPIDRGDFDLLGPANAFYKLPGT